MRDLEKINLSYLHPSFYKEKIFTRGTRKSSNLSGGVPLGPSVSFTTARLWPEHVHCNSAALFKSRYSTVQYPLPPGYALGYGFD